MIQRIYGSTDGKGMKDIYMFLNEIINVQFLKLFLQDNKNTILVHLAAKRMGQGEVMQDKEES